MATQAPRGGLLGRVKPLEAILATAEKKSLHRSLGAVQLTMFGIGCVIGTGIFVLTAAGAQKAGPGLMLAFIIAGAVCVVAALCYAEIADFARTIGKVARMVGADAQGYRILSNIGKRGGQEVPHLHVHLFGGAPLGPMLAR